MRFANSSCMQPSPISSRATKKREKCARRLAIVTAVISVISIYKMAEFWLSSRWNRSGFPVWSMEVWFGFGSVISNTRPFYTWTTWHSLFDGNRPILWKVLIHIGLIFWQPKRVKWQITSLSPTKWKETLFVWTISLFLHHFTKLTADICTW